MICGLFKFFAKKICISLNTPVIAVQCFGKLFQKVAESIKSTNKCLTISLLVAIVCCLLDLILRLKGTFFLVQQLVPELLLNLALVYVIYQRHYCVWHIAELTTLHEPVAVDPEMLMQLQQEIERNQFDVELLDSDNCVSVYRMMQSNFEFSDDAGSYQGSDANDGSEGVEFISQKYLDPVHIDG